MDFRLTNCFRNSSINQTPFKTDKSWKPKRRAHCNDWDETNKDLFDFHERSILYGKQHPEIARKSAYLRKPGKLPKNPFAFSARKFPESPPRTCQKVRLPRGNLGNYHKIRAPSPPRDFQKVHNNPPRNCQKISLPEETREITKKSVCPLRQEISRMSTTVHPELARFPKFV